MTFQGEATEKSKAEDNELLNRCLQASIPHSKTGMMLTKRRERLSKEFFVEIKHEYRPFETLYKTLF
jgi:hypothetical protein